MSLVLNCAMSRCVVNGAMQLPHNVLCLLHEMALAALHADASNGTTILTTMGRWV